MKKFLSVLLASSLLLAFAGCGKTEVVEENDNNLKDWQIKYEETLQECLDSGMLIGGVYVDDIDGDSIPTVAIASNPYMYKIPDMILNFSGGKLAIVGEIDEVESGDSVASKLYFVSGTNDLVYRTYGNSSGTFGENEYQKIYTLEANGNYDDDVEDFELSDEVEEEYMNYLASGGNNIGKYQDYIFNEMDTELEKTFGKPVALVDFNDVVKDFSVVSGEDMNANQQDAVEYLNEKLGINLIYN